MNKWTLAHHEQQKKPLKNAIKFMLFIVEI